MDLLAEIRRFQKRHNITDTRFGRDAINDPRLVRDLKRGRELRPGTTTRIRSFRRDAR